MVQMVRQLITGPSAYMQRKTGEPSIKWELLTLFIIGALSVPGIYLITQEVLAETESDEMRFVVAGWIIRPILIIFGLWIAYSIVLHFLSRHYNGRGPIRDLFKGIAWALVPLGLANLVQTAALYFAFTDVTVTQELEGIGPSEQMDSLMQTLVNDPFVMASTLVIIGALLWSGYLMSFVVEHAKNVSREDARKIVAVPITVHVLLVIWALIQGTFNFAMLL